MTALGLLALGAVAAWSAPESGPRLELTFGAKTNPVGGAVTGALVQDVGGVDLGPYLGVYFFWYELDFYARKSLFGGFIVLSGWVGAEPGWFFRAGDVDAGRVWGPRALTRGRVEINLRNDYVWLYSRTTPLLRVRSFPEYDPFRDATMGTELAIEQSVALMGSPFRRNNTRVWIYAELTLEAERTVGWLDRLPRGGVIIEELRPGLSLDLDFYYSLMDNDIGGPGALLVVWWNRPLRRRTNTE